MPGGHYCGGVGWYNDGAGKVKKVTQALAEAGGIYVLDVESA
jgi:hypothetical protein